MALIIRIDVDRTYGKRPFSRLVLSRLSSDLYFPRIKLLGYLRELKILLHMLNIIGARAYVFFRRCTLPSSSVMKLIQEGKHEIGLHLENSRSSASFLREKSSLERHIGRPIAAASKHGSGRARQGIRHFAPYEPDKYVVWAKQSGMRLFFGNLEDPTLRPTKEASGFYFFPSAFWLERKTEPFTVDWLVNNAQSSDTVLLVHPENVLADPSLMEDFWRLITSLPSRILE